MSRYPGPGEVGIPSRDGAYFRHFPDSGYRARTSFNYYRPGTNHSSAMSGSVASNSYRRWKRAPAATEITVYDADNVSAEQSEEGGSGSFEQGKVLLLIVVMPCILTWWFGSELLSMAFTHWCASLLTHLLLGMMVIQPLWCTFVCSCLFVLKEASNSSNVGGGDSMKCRGGGSGNSSRSSVSAGFS